MKILSLLVLFVAVTACNHDTKTEQPSPRQFDEVVEKAAIMKAIEGETLCFYKGDYECWKKYFVQADYSFQGWNNNDGSIDAKVGWQAVDNKIKAYLRENLVEPGTAISPDVQRKNIVTRFFTPELAYLVWDQLNGSKEKKTFTMSKEERIMEKINGEWKIANVSAFWDYKNELPAGSVR